MAVVYYWQIPKLMIMFGNGDGTFGDPTHYPADVSRPNPFGSTASFSYVLADAGPVELSIYDVQGRLIDVLVDQRQVAGTHVATWDALDVKGESVPAGVYFARLRIAGRMTTRKLVYAR